MRTKAIVAIAAVLMLAGLGGGGWYYFKSSKSPSSNVGTPPAQTGETEPVDNSSKVNLASISKTLTLYFEKNKVYPSTNNTLLLWTSADADSTVLAQALIPFATQNNQLGLRELLNPPAGKKYGYRSDGKTDYELTATLDNQSDPECVVEGSFCIYRIRNGEIVSSKEASSSCASIAEKLFSAIKNKDVGGIQSMETTKIAGPGTDIKVLGDIVNEKDYNDLLSYNMVSSSDNSSSSGFKDPNSNFKFFACTGSTKYSSIPTEGFFLIDITNAEGGWKVIQFYYIRKSIQEFGNLTQDLQGIKKQTGFTVYQPTHLPEHYGYVNTVLLDPTKQPDGQLHKSALSIFSPHPEKLNLFGDDGSSPPSQQVMFVQTLDYKTTEKNELNSFNNAHSSNEVVSEVDLGNGVKGIYSSRDIIIVENTTLISISADDSVSKDELINIAKSLVEVR